jgi:hypothetical protein
MEVLAIQEFCIAQIPVVPRAEGGCLDRPLNLGGDAASGPDPYARAAERLSGWKGSVSH